MGARQSNLFRPRQPRHTAVSLSLGGARELIHNFERLPVRLQKKVTRSAVSKVARRMVTVIKETIDIEQPPPIETGLLRKSIGFRTWTSRTSKWVVGASIGPRRGWGTLVVRDKKGEKKSLTKAGIAKAVAAGGTFSRAQFSDPVKYVHLVEGGAVRPKHGTVQPRRFMEHSMLRSKDVLTAVLRKEIHDGLEREVRKLVKAASYGR